MSHCRRRRPTPVSNHSTAAPPMKSLSVSSAVQAASTSRRTSRVIAREVEEGNSGDRCHHASWGSEATAELGAAARGRERRPLIPPGPVACREPAPRRVRPAGPRSSDVCSASSTSTTARPFAPSVGGRSPCRTHSTKCWSWTASGSLRREVRRDDVAIAVGHRGLARSSESGRPGGRPCRGPGSLLGGEVVEDDHPPAADHGHPTDLARVEPAHVDVGLEAPVLS